MNAQRVLCGLLMIAVVLVVIGCGSKSSGMDFDAFKKALGVSPSTIVTLTKSELHALVGKPDKVQVIESDVILYYRVREGTVQITVIRVMYDNDEVLLSDSKMNLL